MNFYQVLLVLLGVASGFQLEDHVQDVMVNFHNLERSKYCLDEIQWDQQLADEAIDYAEQCKLTRSENNENLYGSVNENFNPIRALSEWLREETEWECGSCCDDQAQNYKQIVWNTTKSFGCGVAKCDFGEGNLTWVVCKYDPPNNNDREPFPLGTCTNCYTTESTQLTRGGDIIDVHRTDTERPYTSGTYKKYTKIAFPTIKPSNENLPTPTNLNQTNPDIQTTDIPIVYLDPLTTDIPTQEPSIDGTMDHNEGVNGWFIAIICIIIIGTIVFVGIIIYFVTRKDKIKSIV